MLKSTHKAVALPPLPPGWTEHKAPTGHSYYYNAETKQSTYTRPAPPPPPVAPIPLTPSQSFLAYTAVGSQPSAGTAFGGHQGGQGHDRGHGGFRGGRGGHDRPRERPQPKDKPISRRAIPGCDNWELVYTKLGRRFVYNTEKDQSFWRIPDKLKDGILDLDQLRIKEKANALAKAQEPVDTGEAPGAAGRPEAESAVPEARKDGGDDSSEYEEVEVTDDEDDEENPSKRQRTEEPNPDGPVEFNEEDIAFQLAAMGQEYGLDPAEYGEVDMADYEEGEAGLEITHEDSAALFKDLLNDFGINPYSPWEKLVEEGKLVDDMRYTALTSMKARKEVWEEWSRERIAHLRELREKEEKKDPRIPYLAFLQRQANPKLYWPEFKRKYKKEPEMKDTAMADKDREKLYREHINRLKLPSSALKSDLSTLLKSQPLSQLNRSTLPTHLPPTVSADIRYISLPPEIRDPLVEAYISTLAAAPDANEAEETEEALKQRREKDRRLKALEEREARVAEEKRRQRRNLEFGKGRLREEEVEIERAMSVNKKGLAGHLMDVDGEK